MNIERLTEPSTEPVSLEEAKEHLGIIDGERDQWTQQAISEARDYVEQYCGRIWASAHFAVLYEQFAPALELPPGTTGVIGISYLDPDGVEQTIDDAEYVANLRRCTVAPVSSWPSGTDVRIECVVGADASASPPGIVPPSVRAALKLVLGDLFANREASVVGVSRVDNPAVERLLHFYRQGLGV